MQPHCCFYVFLAQILPAVLQNIYYCKPDEKTWPTYDSRTNLRWKWPLQPKEWEQVATDGDVQNFPTLLRGKPVKTNITQHCCGKGKPKKVEDLSWGTRTSLKVLLMETCYSSWLCFYPRLPLEMGKSCKNWYCAALLWKRKAKEIWGFKKRH